MKNKEWIVLRYDYNSVIRNRNKIFKEVLKVLNGRHN